MSVFKPLIPNPVLQPCSNTGKFNSHMLLIQEMVLMIYTRNLTLVNLISSSICLGSIRLHRNRKLLSLSSSPHVYAHKYVQGSKLVRTLLPHSLLSQVQQQLLQWQVHAHRQEVYFFPPFFLETKLCGRKSSFGLPTKHTKAGATSTAISSFFQEKVSAYPAVLCDFEHIQAKIT